MTFESDELKSWGAVHGAGVLNDLTGRRRSESDALTIKAKLQGAFGVDNKFGQDASLSALALESAKLSALQRDAWTQRETPRDYAPLVYAPAPTSNLVSLHTTVVTAGPLPEGFVADVASHLFYALAELHARQVIHRNVTAATVLIAPDGTVVLSGSCQATTLDDTEALNKRVGTLGYLAPEVVIGEESSLAVDAFGAGAALYFALAGQPPFTGSPQRQLRKTLRCQVPMGPLGLASESCQQTVKALMQRDPLDRPTMEELLAGPWWPHPVSQD